MIIFYFDSAHAIIVHDMVIAISGGVPGVINIGQLESLVCHIQSDEYYPSFIDKLTHLIFGITKFHCFIDGNKRSAIAGGAYFLELNGYGWLTQHFIREMENVIVWVAEGSVSKELLHKIVSCLCNCEEYPENIKLELIDLLGGI